MQTPELIEQLEQRGLKVTVNQARKAIAELGSNPDDDHPVEMVDCVYELLSQGRTTKKNGKSVGAAIAKANQQQAEGKGQLTAAVQQNAVSTVRQSRRQGKELAQLGNRARATAYLEESAKGMNQFSESIDEAGDTISAIIDDAIANYDGSDEEDFLPASGAFNLL